jgi:hypothetical protein
MAKNRDREKNEHGKNAIGCDNRMINGVEVAFAFHKYWLIVKYRGFKYLLNFISICCV